MTELSNVGKPDNGFGATWRYLSVGLCCLTVAGHVSAAPLLPKEYKALDANHVNFQASSVYLDLVDVAIGSASRKLSNSIYITKANFSFFFGVALDYATNFSSNIEISSVLSDTDKTACAYYGGSFTYEVLLGTSSDKFCSVGSKLVSMRNAASKLTKNTDGSFTYITGDGTTYSFLQMNKLARKTRTYPDGLTLSFFYKDVVIPSATGASERLTRLQSVVRNDGFQLLFKYKSNIAPTKAPSISSTPDWSVYVGTIAINAAVDYCDPSADSCNFSRSWPQSSFSQATLTNGNETYSFQDYAGNISRFTTGKTFSIMGGGLIDGVFILGYKPPTSPTDDTIQYQYCGVGMESAVCGATRDGATWKYSKQAISNDYDTRTRTIRVSPTGVNASMISKSNHYGPSIAPLFASYDEAGNNFLYETDTPYNRLKTVIMPEGNSIGYLYDARGNITQETHTPKPGSTLKPIIKTTGFDAVCNNTITCNKPNWTKDAKGNQTDYRYDPVHGGVLSETSPPDAKGVRPQKRFSYAQRYAWVKNAAGAYVKASTPIWVLTQESYCKTSAAAASGTGCAAGSSDEVITTYDYGPDAGPNNLFLRGTAVLADGQTRRTCYAYDVLGNKLSETTPNAALASCP